VVIAAKPVHEKDSWPIASDDPVCGAANVGSVGSGFCANKECLRGSFQQLHEPSLDRQTFEARVSPKETPIARF
jgi:hypothetical protein